MERRAFLGASLAAGLAQEPPRIVVTTRLVQVSVVVHDGRGRPVNDLTKEDFAVFDGGRQETIIGFYRSAGNKEETGGQAKAPAPPAPPRTVTALLFDGVNTNLADQSFATDRVLEFLRRLRPGDSVALFALAEDLVLLHDFTDDAGALTAALAQRKPGLLAQWMRERSARGVMRGVLRHDRAVFTLEALRAIGEHLAGIPGRKNLVWVSSGFPTLIAERERGRAGYTESMEPQMQAVARAVGDADVAIYPVSALGLVGMPQSSAAQGAPGRTMGRPSAATGPQISNSRQTGPLYSMMNAMAEQTGGQAFIERNDLDKALDRATEDLASTYTLAFRPSHDRWNGEYRQLRVRLKRKGLRIRHRPGYVAAPGP